MISVVVPTLNAEASLARSLAALVPAAVDGLVREAIVVDGGSRDRTQAIADSAGAELVRATGGRGGQLAAGAAKARFPWLLFLHADTVLSPDWEGEASRFMERVDTGSRPIAAAAFRFRLDDRGARPRTLERLVAFRCAALRLPYGDQGLLIPRRLYDEIGGYRPLPLMEDVDLVRRLGRRRIVMLDALAVTSAERFRRDGYVRRSARNLACLALYTLRVPPHVISRIYG
jgi:rSAM/selenodomain-associated transferase 2